MGSYNDELPTFFFSINILFLSHFFFYVQKNPCKDAKTTNINCSSEVNTNLLRIKRLKISYEQKIELYKGNINWKYIKNYLYDLLYKYILPI